MCSAACLGRLAAVGAFLTFSAITTPAGVGVLFCSSFPVAVEDGFLFFFLHRLHELFCALDIAAREDGGVDGIA